MKVQAEHEDAMMDKSKITHMVRVDMETRDLVLEMCRSLGWTQGRCLQLCVERFVRSEEYRQAVQAMSKLQDI